MFIKFIVDLINIDVDIFNILLSARIGQREVVSYIILSIFLTIIIIVILLVRLSITAIEGLLGHFRLEFLISLIVCSFLLL